MSTLDGEEAATIDPVGSDDNPYPEDLWAGLDALTQATSARFLSIPHNSNLSKGYMFADRTIRGEDITADYARTRMEWEPVAEVTQFKGDSETHPALSPNDEFADFEQFEFYLQASPANLNYTPAVGDYARTALMRGLEIEERIGVNPFQFGMIGSTDSHTSVASSEEPNFWGKVGIDSIPENKRDTVEGSGTVDFNGWNMSASGLAAVWAEENTRESIFEAFTRKEVYATTGSRIALRVFGGWGFAEGSESADDLAEIGYTEGVPMGGDLTSAPETGAPVQLLIRATKDPEGANLDRVQVFHIIEALNGNVKLTDFERFMNSENGPALLAKRADLPTMLDNHAPLKSLPQGTVGRAYVEFMESEGLSAAGLVAESETNNAHRQQFDDDLTWYMNRGRDTHDLYHVLTGYGRDALGEAALLGYTHSQHGGLGINFIAFMGGRTIAKEAPRKANIKEVIGEGRRNGKAAARIVDQDIDALLREPIADARARLGINEPVLYKRALEVFTEYELDPAAVAA
eukprot:g4888.t1